MYYKVQLDGEIIDALDRLDCCKYVPRSRSVLRCTAKDSPEGIISARTGRYYHVDGWPGFPADVDSLTVVLSEIDVDTYDAITAALDDGAYPEDGSLQDTEEESEESPKTTAQKLNERIEELESQNAMLLECLLEMSEIVYG